MLVLGVHQTLGVPVGSPQGTARICRGVVAEKTVHVVGPDSVWPSC